MPNAIARPLVASLVHEAVAHEHDIAALRARPAGGLIGFDEAVRAGAGQGPRRRRGDPLVRPRPARTRAAEPLPTDPDWSGGTVYIDERERDGRRAGRRRCGGSSRASAARHGWYSFPLAWSVRGWLDRLVGGVGLRRGRRDPHRLQVGEALDFWRVEEIVPGELLRLRAEMRLPGRAWLEMRVDAGRRRPQPSTGSGPSSCRAGWPGTRTGRRCCRSTRVVFGGMARNIARTAEQTA